MKCQKYALFVQPSPRPPPGSPRLREVLEPLSERGQGLQKEVADWRIQRLHPTATLC